jgi:hypothetical protein
MDARTTARLEKLTKAIEDACDRVVAEPSKATMHVRVAQDMRMVMVGRNYGQDYISVQIKDVRDILMVKSCRIGRDPEDSLFKLKLLPEFRAVAAPLEDAGAENVLIPILPIDIVGTTAPKEVQRIIRLINAI